MAGKKKKRGGGSNGADESRIGGKWKKVERRRGEGKRRGTWCVPALGGADGGEGEARASSARPIYRSSRSVPSGEIFLMAALIHHARSWLTLSGLFAIVATWPCARRSALAATLVAWRRGDHGVDIDEFIVREERGEEERKGAPWGLEVSSCHRLPLLA